MSFSQYGGHIWGPRGPSEGLRTGAHPPRRPNKINENVISFLNTFPREIGLEGQIDRDTQFEKSFLLPLQIITSVIGWETERKANLDFLFA